MKNSTIVGRLLKIVRPYRTRALLSLVAMAGTASTQPMLTKSMQLLLDNGFSEHPVTISLWLVPALLMSIFALRGVFTFPPLISTTGSSAGS